MNIIFIIHLQLFSIKEHTSLPIFGGFIHNPPVFHCVAMLQLVDPTLWSLIGLFAQNIICVFRLAEGTWVTSNPEPFSCNIILVSHSGTLGSGYGHVIVHLYLCLMFLVILGPSTLTNISELNSKYDVLVIYPLNY